MSRIRAVFLGSPQFAVPSLQALIDAEPIELSLVVTQPDRPAGRGRKLQSPPVKVAALEQGIPVIQPESLREADAIVRLKSINPDVLVVVSYGEILRKSLLELPKFGCINVHPSLLPQYRGSIPIQAAILNGDAESGVSFIKLIRRMDAGPILRQIRFPLHGTETTGQLSEHLSELAAAHLPGTVLDWVKGEIEPTQQDEDTATYTRELSKSDAQIDWDWSASYIERFVRAMLPWPKAWTLINGDRLTITRATRMDDCPAVAADSGCLDMNTNGPNVQTADGIIHLELVQPAGKRVMEATEWVRRFQGSEQLKFDSPGKQRQPLFFARTT
jgi:methionyl-tRNA formyltransferase